MMNIVGMVMMIVGLLMMAGSAGDCDGKCMEYANTAGEMAISLILGLTIAAIGGIIVGYELGKLLNKKTIFSERVNGEFELRRDFKIEKGSKVLIVEDVITTGKSSLECSKLVISNNATIVGYACIIDRSNGRSDIKDKIISQVELNIPTYHKDKLPKELSSIPPVKPGSRSL